MQATNRLKGNCPREKFPGVYCQRAFVFWVIVWEHLSWRGNIIGEKFRREQLSKGRFSLGAIVLGGNCPEGKNAGDYPQFPANLVTFTEEILNGKFHFLCSVNKYISGLISGMALYIYLILIVKIRRTIYSRYSSSFKS